MSKLEEEIISHVMDITFKWERIIQDTHEGFSRFALRERDGREEGRKGGGEAALHFVPLIPPAALVVLGSSCNRG